LPRITQMNTDVFNVDAPNYKAITLLFVAAACTDGTIIRVHSV